MRRTTLVDRAGVCVENWQTRHLEAMKPNLVILLLAVLCAFKGQAQDPKPTEGKAKDDGYRGIWFTLGQKSEYGDKYSGGLATYTANHVPMAIYSKEVNKTFFVYGGAKQQATLLDMGPITIMHGAWCRGAHRA